MPIRPEMKDRHPKDWPAISMRIRERDGNKCKWCGVPNHELGGRDSEGHWFKARPLGEKLLRLEWPKENETAWCYRPLPGGCWDKGPFYELRCRIVRIVLTVAHLNHKPEDCSDENLVALCQRCLLRYDAKHHAATAAATRRKALNNRELFDDA